MKRIGIMEKKREEMRREFLALPHNKRIERMDKFFSELIEVRAKREGISEGEAYLKYIERTESPNR